MEKINITKKIIIKGDFHGRYHGNEISTLSSYADYDIKVIDGKVSDAYKTNYYEVISDDSISFRLSKLEDVKISLRDSESSTEYVFVEDLEDVIIYDIEFKDVIKEGQSTLGLINGKIYGSLVYNEEVQLAKLPTKLPRKTLEIVKDTATKIKAKAERNFFPSLSILFYGFLFVCLATLFKEKLLIFLLFGAGLYILRFIVIFLLRLIFRSAYAVFILLILMGVWFVFSEGLNTNIEENDETIVQEPPKYEELVSRSISWNDYDNLSYYGDFKFKYGDYIKSKENRNNQNWEIYGETSVYKNLYQFDNLRMNLIYETLSKISKENNLGKNHFADVVVSMVQSIPYSLMGDFKNEIVTPIEFFYYRKGDCDSRTVLIYTILKKFGYDVVILNSNLYGHSMIGINIPTYGKYKLISGKKYYFWETTGKGWTAGTLPPDTWNISKWYLALK